MIVQIVKKGTSAVIAEYPVNVGGLNYEPSEQEFFGLAWKNAVEDGLVKDDERDSYVLSKK